MTGPQRPESREPGTEAGRRLLEYDVTETLDGRFEVGPDFLRGLPADILAIEAEARAAERTETEPRCPDCGLTASRLGEIHINAQVARLADPRPPEPPATGPVPTPEAPTAATGPRDGSEGSGR